MVFNFKKSTRRFRRAANNAYFRKKSGYFPNMGRIASDVRNLKSLVNAEKKFSNTVSSGLALASSTTGNVVQLTTIATGDTETDREGNSLKLSYAYVEGYIQLHSAATSDTVRVSLVQDLQPNTATFTYNQVWDLTALSSAMAIRSISTTNRFKVLKTNLISLDVGQTRKHFKFYVPLEFHAKFASSATAIPQTNSLTLCFCGSNTVNTSTVVYYSRIRFIDN
nr:capsid protein [Cressdnaviricota sp.]UOF83104.1 capsid protein [Cressdnaviricota sp.]